MILKVAPNIKVEILDTVAEVIEDGGKVWMLSRITGMPDAEEKESVDMMVFNSEGIVVASKDLQRAV